MINNDTSHDLLKEKQLKKEIDELRTQMLNLDHQIN